MNTAPAGTHHTLIIGDCTKILPTLPDRSIALIVTSLPYFNAEHDYKNYYQSYDEYRELLHQVARESIRVLADGRIFALNIDDMRVDGRLYPLVADATTAFLKAGYDYRARITWVKPKGFALRQRQSGLAVKYPYPMYPYFSNLTESILLFQSGKFDYKSVTEQCKQKSRIDKDKWSREWNLNVWNICNVLPVKGRVEENIAAFPDEIPKRLITLFSYKSETVLDCFLGSGTTMKIARQLRRNSIGIEIDPALEPVIREKTGFAVPNTRPDTFKVIPQKNFTKPYSLSPKQPQKRRAHAEEENGRRQRDEEHPLPVLQRPPLLHTILNGQHGSAAILPNRDRLSLH
jgi:site-specific DNA-methyltransferase (adenine-specific)